MRSRGPGLIMYRMNFSPAVGLTMALRLGQSGVEKPSKSQLGVLGLILAALFIVVLVVDIRG